MKQVRNLIYLLIIGIGFILSCDPNPCRSGDEIMMKMGFYTYKKGVLEDSLVDRFTLYGLDCISDTSCVFYYKRNDLDQIGFFLSSINDSSRFAFWIDTVKAVFYDTTKIIDIDSIRFYVTKTVVDTIEILADSLVRIIYIDSTAYDHDPDQFTVRYTRQQSMESPDCGVYIDFKINSVTYTKKHFDTLIIMQPIVDENGFENIRVIF